MLLIFNHCRDEFRFVNVYILFTQKRNILYIFYGTKSVIQSVIIYKHHKNLNQAVNHLRKPVWRRGRIPPP
jgi:hypothetical protein